MFLVLLFVVAAEAAPVARVRCINPSYPECVAQGIFSCPSGCPETCPMSCDICAPVCPRSPPPPPSPLLLPIERSPPPPPLPPPLKKRSPPLPGRKSPPPPPPHHTHPSPPPPPSGVVSGQQRARCKNKNYPLCYGVELPCPAGCPSQCEVDCTICRPVGSKVVLRPFGAIIIYKRTL
ncbi:hypothetical protein NL676_031199 [Syzygium grande]|nr:hypothetical protein NL676_031199 [Syzygium grande]